MFFLFWFFFCVLWFCVTPDTYRGENFVFPYRLAVDLDEPRRDVLLSLPNAAREQSPEGGNVEPPLQGCKRHLHVGRDFSPPARQVDLLLSLPVHEADLAAAAAVGLLGAVAGRHVRWIHVDDRVEAPAEQALPLLFLDVLAVVGAHHSLGCPFLLEEGQVGTDIGSKPRYVVEILYVPRLPEFLFIATRLVRRLVVSRIAAGFEAFWAAF